LLKIILLQYFFIYSFSAFSLKGSGIVSNSFNFSKTSFWGSSNIAPDGIFTFHVKIWFPVSNLPFLDIPFPLKTLLSPDWVPGLTY